MAVQAVAGAQPVIGPEMQAAAEQASQVVISQDLRERVKVLLDEMDGPEWKSRMAPGQTAARQALGLDEGEAPTPGHGGPGGPTGRLVVCLAMAS